MPFNANGSHSPQQPSKNITIAFRIATHVFPYGLVSVLNPRQPRHIDLAEKVTTVLQYIPSGLHGFEHNLTWVYLISGAISSPGSSFRSLFEDRLAQLGDSAKVGNIGRAAVLVHEVWAQNDRLPDNSTLYIHWRDVMESKEWDFLFV